VIGRCRVVKGSTAPRQSLWASAASQPGGRRRQQLSGRDLDHVRRRAAPESPFLLLLGADARQGFQAVLDAERQELDRWESLILSTGFPT